jgi:hypothetical protein
MNWEMVCNSAQHFYNSYRPIALLLLSALLWAILFPVYLFLARKLQICAPSEPEIDASAKKSSSPGKVPLSLVIGLCISSIVGAILGFSEMLDPSVNQRAQSPDQVFCLMIPSLMPILFLLATIFCLTKRNREKPGKADILSIVCLVGSGTFVFWTTFKLHRSDEQTLYAFLLAWLASSILFRKGSVVLSVGGGFLAAIGVLMFGASLGNYLSTIIR